MKRTKPATRIWVILVIACVVLWRLFGYEVMSSAMPAIIAILLLIEAWASRKRR